MIRVSGTKKGHVAKAQRRRMHVLCVCGRSHVAHVCVNDPICERLGCDCAPFRSQQVLFSKSEGPRMQMPAKRTSIGRIRIKRLGACNRPNYVDWLRHRDDIRMSGCNRHNSRKRTSPPAAMTSMRTETASPTTTTTTSTRARDKLHAFRNPTRVTTHGRRQRN